MSVIHETAHVFGHRLCAQCSKPFTDCSAAFRIVGTDHWFHIHCGSPDALNRPLKWEQIDPRTGEITNARIHGSRARAYAVSR